MKPYNLCTASERKKKKKKRQNEKWVKAEKLSSVLEIP